ncbi:MAG TPA: bifunctional sulfate adenylyltransferase/adenylylsulfate kinase [Vicinamibacterales bacterium]|jgi:sulfate adenylyltransferase
MPDTVKTASKDSTPADFLISPYGGVLTGLLVDSERNSELKAQSTTWPNWVLTPRQLCDFELLATGAFSPLSGFMSRADHESVCAQLRLSDGTLWPIPITLDVTPEFAGALQSGQRIGLRDPEGRLLAALTVGDVWQPDKNHEATSVFGTTDTLHPGVSALFNAHPFYVGGSIEALELPSHYDFSALRRTPSALRHEFAARGWNKVVAFQTRNPMHRAHVELTRRAVEETGAKLLIQPVVGMTKPGDVDHFTRVRCYQVALNTYPADTAMLSLLPLAMRMGGPREVLLHAIIRRNYGCTHLIVGRDHAGPGANSRGEPFYGPYDSQKMLNQHQAEIGVTMVPSREMVYVADESRYMPEDRVPNDARVLRVSGSELRRRLATGEEIPEWFSFPEVVRELRRTHPSRQQQGFTIFFTGLSGSGKSTIANVLLVRLLERGDRKVTLLDGDLVRRHLSSELGFSREHRDLNIERIGFVASEITRCGGIALCAAIAPYDGARRKVRSMIEPAGGYVLVHVSTPLALCEQRDTKGLYAKARSGQLAQFTGISDPYEAPADADLVIDTSGIDPVDASGRILSLLAERGYLPDLPHRETTIVAN